FLGRGEFAQARVARNHDAIIGRPRTMPGRVGDHETNTLDVLRRVELRLGRIEPREEEELAHRPRQHEAVVRVEIRGVGMAGRAWSSPALVWYPRAACCTAFCTTRSSAVCPSRRRSRWARPRCDSSPSIASPRSVSTTPGWP